MLKYKTKKLIASTLIATSLLNVNDNLKEFNNTNIIEELVLENDSNNNYNIINTEITDEEPIIKDSGEYLEKDASKTDDEPSKFATIGVASSFGLSTVGLAFLKKSLKSKIKKKK